MLARAAALTDINPAEYRADLVVLLDGAEVLGRAALLATLRLSDERQVLYSDLVFAALSEAARAALEDLTGTPMTGGDTLRTLVGLARYPSLIHGPAHWSRVRRFGALLAEKEQLPGAARACVEIFALLHDLAREDDGGGNQHAIDGAAYMDEVIPAVFGRLSLDQIKTVRVAIRSHSDGMVARQASDNGLFDRLDWPRDLLTRTVGCCWDADRLDLPRVGIHPVPELMSTAGWRDVLTLSLRIHDGIRG